MIWYDDMWWFIRKRYEEGAKPPDISLNIIIYGNIYEHIYDMKYLLSHCYIADLQVAKVMLGSLQLSGFQFVSDFLNFPHLQTLNVLKFACLQTSDVSRFASHQSSDPMSHRDCQGISTMSSSAHSPAMTAISFKFSCNDITLKTPNISGNP